MDRKAVLDTSITVIVIALIDFVVIGLGVSFVSGQFKSISGAASEIQKEVKEQLMEELVLGEDKLVVLERNVNLDINQNQDLVFGVYNDLEKELVYEVEVEIGQKEQASNKDFSKDLDFLYHHGPFFLEKAQAGMNLLKIQGKETGNYLVKITIYNKNNNQEYAKKSFFVEVN